MYPKIAQLILNSGKKTDSSCDIFISQPDAVKEKLAGKLFIVAEIKSNRPAGIKMVNFLIDNINHNYYQNEKILLREKIPSLKVDHIFEATLAKVNKNFTGFLKSEKIDISEVRLNVTAGIIYDDNLYFANAGNNKMYLLYKKKASDNDGSKYSITEVTDEGRPESTKEKLFSSVLSGKIPVQGYFFFANEALPEYLSQAQIMSVVSSLPPVSAMEQLKNILSDINAQTPFLAFLIKNSLSEKKEIRETAVVNTRDSIIDLNNTEDRTENLLAPSGLISFKKWIPSINLKKDSKQSSDKLFLKDKIFKKKASNKIKKGFEMIKNLLINLAGIAFSLIAKKFKKSGGSDSIDSAKTAASGLMSKISNISIPRKHKILFAAALVFIGLFAFNTYQTKNEQIHEAEKERYAEATAEIKQKQNHIDANLLYSNDENARKLFKEIEALMSDLPKDSEEYGEIEDKYNEQLDRLKKVKVLETLELADISGADNQANPQNLLFIDGKQKIYAADPAGRSVYIVDLSDQSIKTAVDLEKPITDLKNPTVVDNLIYYQNQNGLIYFDINTDSFGLLGQSSENLDGASDFSVYSGRVYALFPETNQIYRYNLSSVSGLSAPGAWVSGRGIDLQNATSLSIDGHIYVLTSKGEVYKLLRGEIDEFKFDAVEPELANPSKIIASEDKDYLYVLEPTNNRLILYNKKGQFISQYESDSFNDLKDFNIDEKNKTFYFLNGGRILKSDMPHLMD